MRPFYGLELLFLWESYLIHDPYFLYQLLTGAIKLGYSLYLSVSLVGLIALGDLYQYGAWARSPEFTIVEVSRQISRDVESHAFLGGPYAYVLALENSLPALPFYTYLTNVPPQTLDPQITHIVVDADSILKDGPFNEEGLFKIYSEDMKHATLLKSYTLRGYLVKLYQIER